MQHLNAGVNTDANTWTSAIALWYQGPIELKMLCMKFYYHSLQNPQDDGVSKFFYPTLKSP